MDYGRSIAEDQPLFGERARQPRLSVRQACLSALALSAAFAAGALWASAPRDAAAGAKRVRATADPTQLPSHLRFRDNVVFEEDFDVFDLTKWKHEITLSGGGNWEFQWYTNNRTNSFVKDGVLHMKATPTSEQFGIEFIEEGGTLDIWGMTPATACTSNAFSGCARTSGMGGNILNPVQSAKIRTYESFSFKYGRLEVRAKMPRGDWLWPAIWLLPAHEQYGQWPASGEIDLIESRGNTNQSGSLQGAGTDTVGTTLHWGPNAAENPWDVYHGTWKLNGTDYNKDFHTFGLYWSESELYAYVDDDANRVIHANFNETFWEKGLRQRPHWTEFDNPWAGSPSISAPYDQEFYLVMNLACGGINGYFNESMTGSDGSPMPWQNANGDSKKAMHAVDDFWRARDKWLPTWKGDDSHLQIDWVRIWQD